MILPPALIALVATALATPIEQIPLKQDPEPRFPWIQNFASVGDSYAAGLGAGNRLDWSCSRYDHSYPHLLHTTYLGDNPNRTHQFLACSGTTSTEITLVQLPLIQEPLDLLTISGGGNDVGLTPILNSCVYQIFTTEPGDCAKAIEEAYRRINEASELRRNMTLLLNLAKAKIHPDHGVVYVTGYASFFGTEDRLCNNVTWSFWRFVLPHLPKQYLRLSLRRELDVMVRAVNGVLRNVTLAAGNNFRFVDYDDLIKEKRGRYCEKGVNEPDPNRLGLDFYEWGTVDDLNEKEPPRNRSFGVKSEKEEVERLLHEMLEAHPELEFDEERGLVNKSLTAEDGVVVQGPISDEVWWLLPDQWKRLFHLRPAGQDIIARLIMEDLERNGKGVKENVGEL